MARFQKKKLSKKEQKAFDKTVNLVLDKPDLSEKNESKKEKRQIALPSVVSVKDFAEHADLPVTKIIGELMRNGILATINQTIDFDTAAIIGDDLNVEIVKEETDASAKHEEKKEAVLEDERQLVSRPPVVTIMGHVDHGKTSLLDYIRKTHVASGESGGITQHITAYQVTLKKIRDEKIKHRTITFIDTPGHAAFSAMREHGAAITDIAVVIVAANDGVKPQTEEVIKAAQNSNVPIIVAINKIDLPDADVMKTKQQLADYNLIPEEWGGKTVIVDISAKTGKGVDDLLEMILLQADIMDLKANPNTKAVGVVIESQMQKGKGAVARVLIENGTLKRCDPIAIGSSYGKVRILEDFAGNVLEEAGPSTPVRISGLRSVPNFGDKLIDFNTEREAKDAALSATASVSTMHIATAVKMSETCRSEESSKNLQYNIVLKSDVKGSLEAIKKSLSEIKAEGIKLNIVSEGVGAISESDVTLAKASKAEVIGFRVKVLGAAKKISETEKVAVKTFDIIYQLIDAIKERMVEILPPLIIEEEIGSGIVLAIFRDDRKGFVAGGRVESGKIALGDNIKFFQNDNLPAGRQGEKYRATVSTLRREKSEAKEVESGSECGFGLPPYAKVSVGDKWVTFKVIEQKQTL